MFVYYILIYRKIIWRLTARMSRIEYYGLRSSIDYIVVYCPDVVIQWLTQGIGRGSIKAYRIRY